MAKSALETYRTAEMAAASGRDLEAAALFKAARQLEAVQRGWDSSDRDGRLEEALRYNTRLWTFFQTELAEDDHPMPRELRLNLLQLSKFIDKRTFELLAHPEPSKLLALININRQIGMGLSTKAAEPEPAVSAAS
jgi:flagellar protein FlaF